MALLVQVILALVFTILGVILGIFLTSWLARPLLRQAGTGRGRSGDFWTYSATIENTLTLRGIRFQETTLLGRQVIGAHQFGRLVKRDPATGCIASLHDAETGERLTTLWMLDPERRAWRQRIEEIPSGARCVIRLFARRDADVDRFFPFKPQSPDDPESPPEVPAEAVMSRRTRMFEVRVTYDNTRVLRFQAGMRWDVTNNDGRLYGVVRSGDSSGSSRW